MRRDTRPPPARGHGPRGGDTARQHATCAAKAERTGRGASTLCRRGRAAGAPGAVRLWWRWPCRRRTRSGHGGRGTGHGGPQARRGRGAVDAGRAARPIGSEQTGRRADVLTTSWPDVHRMPWGRTETRIRRVCGATGPEGHGGREARYRRPHGPAGWPRGARLRTVGSHKAKNHTTGHVGARGLPRERQRTGATGAQASRFLHRGRRGRVIQKGSLAVRGPSLPFVACATKGESCCAGEALHPMGQTTPTGRISRGKPCIIGGGVCKTAEKEPQRRGIAADYGGRTVPQDLQTSHLPGHMHAIAHRMRLIAPIMHIM